VAAVSFDPDWVVKPGETLREWIDENHLTVRAVAGMCGRMKPDRLQRIIDGKQRITRDDARRLQAATNIPATLWLKLELAYRAGLAAGKTDIERTEVRGHDEQVDLAVCGPVSVHRMALLDDKGDILVSWGFEDGQPVDVAEDEEITHIASSVEITIDVKPRPRRVRKQT
jgi:plasmid maintenance system antidote protein VapI